VPLDCIDDRAEEECVLGEAATAEDFFGFFGAASRVADCAAENLLATSSGTTQLMSLSEVSADRNPRITSSNPTPRTNGMT